MTCLLTVYNISSHFQCIDLSVAYIEGLAEAILAPKISRLRGQVSKVVLIRALAKKALRFEGPKANRPQSLRRSQWM